MTNVNSDNENDASLILIITDRETIIASELIESKINRCYITKATLTHYAINLPDINSARSISNNVTPDSVYRLTLIQSATILFRNALMAVFHLSNIRA